MKAMLDTNICIYIIKRRPQAVLDRFSAFPVGDIGISSITLAELEYGAAKSAQPKKNRESRRVCFRPSTLQVLTETRLKSTVESGPRWRGTAFLSARWICSLPHTPPASVQT